jgi:hypothetical protein
MFSLSQQSLSLNHFAFIDILANTENLLIIQDLDNARINGTTSKSLEILKIRLLERD